MSEHQNHELTEADHKSPDGSKDRYPDNLETHGLAAKVNNLEYKRAKTINALGLIGRSYYETQDGEQWDANPGFDDNSSFVQAKAAEIKAKNQARFQAGEITEAQRDTLSRNKYKDPEYAAASEAGKLLEAAEWEERRREAKKQFDALPDEAKQRTRDRIVAALREDMGAHAVISLTEEELERHIINDMSQHVSVLDDQDRMMQAVDRVTGERIEETDKKLDRIYETGRTEQQQERFDAVQQMVNKYRR